MTLPKAIFASVLTFIITFSLGFKFHILQNLNISMFNWYMKDSPQVVQISTNLADIFYVAIFTSLFFGFIITMPIADILWQMMHKRSSTKLSWRRPIINIVIFIGGALLVSIWIFQQVYVSNGVFEKSHLMFDMPKLQLELVKLQWLAGVSLLAVWLSIGILWKKYHA